MQYYPYNSRQSLYKEPFGAVKSDEKVNIRLLLHRDACVYEAFLRVINDGDSVLYEIPLAAGDWLADYRFYSCEIALNTGLYWYDFRYTSEHGQFFVVKEPGGRGIVSQAEGDRWQITVYDKDFTTPAWLKGGIIYQIFPDRFFASGKKKNNVPDDRFLCEDWEKQPEYRQNGEKCRLGNDYYGGDLKGIEEKLPYLESLGVTINSKQQTL